MLHHIGNDLRFAARMLRKNPGFTLAAVLALGLGIGANTAVFSVVNGILLRPLPFHDPEQLVSVYLRSPAQGEARIPLSMADFLDWRDQNTSFSDIAGYTGSSFNYAGGASAEQIDGAAVTTSFFRTLGVSPLLGRSFLPEDEKPGSTRVALISHRLWQRVFAADRAIVGRVVAFNGRDVTIIGVVPESFHFPSREIDVWAAMQITPPARRGPYFLRAVARLLPGVTLDRARAQMAGMRQIIAPQGERVGHQAMPLTETIVGPVRSMLWLLLGAVTLVLLVATANVANLLMVRASAREREIAVRRALGAATGRLAAQLLTESLLLAALGGAVGLGIAWGSVRFLRALENLPVPRLQEVAVDSRVLTFTLLVSIVSGVIFGLAPVLRGFSLDLHISLKEGPRGSDTSGRPSTRDLLVVAETALAMVLLVGSGLLVRSLWKLQSVDPGVDPENVLTMQIIPTGPRYADASRIAAFHRQLLERVESLPGVSAAGITLSLPPNVLPLEDEFTIEGKVPADPKLTPVCPMNIVSSGLFPALRIPLLRGRWFTDSDGPDAPRVVIIDETMARRYFPGEDPVGRRMKQGKLARQNPWMEIVGVVGDVKYEGLGASPRPTFYEPYPQNPIRNAFLVVRTASDPLVLSSSIRGELRGLDREIPATAVRTMRQVLFESAAEPRFRTLLFGLFALISLVLSSLGIYAVISYSVSRRTREMGVRLALGAEPRRIVRLVVAEGMRVVSVGLLIGLAGSLALSHLLTGLLFEVSPNDPATLAGVVFVLGLTAFLASWIPARRIGGLDPLAALREE
jgi:predicted permease